MRALPAHRLPTGPAFKIKEIPRTPNAAEPCLRARLSFLLSITYHAPSTRIYHIPLPAQPSSGWGLYPTVDTHAERAHYRSDLLRAAQGPPTLAQGNCRSYGDACLYERVVSTLPLRHLLEFDSANGLLRAQAGCTLDKIIGYILPRGFFLPVTPGTKFPTLGGCLAADVHGKNHHSEGSIAAFVVDIDLVLADGGQITCSRTEHADVFWATLGGMGLTGLIYAATLRLKKISSAYMRTRTIKTQNFDELCQVFEQTQNEYTYSVAWIDCLATGRKLGRSLLMLGEHASAAEAPANEPFKKHLDGGPSVPFFLPSIALNRLSMQAFNTLYYHRQLSRQRDAIAHYNPYFYPLDFVQHWNRIYGRRGFLQYQFVVPFAGGRELMADILNRIAQRGTASFLAVLKTLGAQGEGLLSFPMPGYTLALDIPLHDRGIIPFLQEINREIVRVGGRIYLAKDAILDREDFEAMYPQLDEFKRIKRTCDPNNHFRSVQSDRLGLT
jgi:decaprenylphospho-beta-D-ribofuranose 2-oxidase